MITSLKGGPWNQKVALSSLPVVLVKYVSAYLKENIVNLGVDKVYEVFSTFPKDNKMKMEWKNLISTTLHYVTKFPNFIP